MIERRQNIITSPIHKRINVSLEMQWGIYGNEGKGLQSMITELLPGRMGRVGELYRNHRVQLYVGSSENMGLFPLHRKSVWPQLGIHTLLIQDFLLFTAAQIGILPPLKGKQI